MWCKGGMTPMKMHFRKGAIVRFTLSCKANINACGKVIEVTDDEIVYLPQEYVSAYEFDRNTGTSKLNLKVSVDEYPEIHLDRALVAMWHYEPVPNTYRTTYYGVYQPSKIVNMEVNHYDDDGWFCKGNGEYFE
jgi:hypothetical protein